MNTLTLSKDVEGIGGKPISGTGLWVQTLTETNGGMFNLTPSTNTEETALPYSGAHMQGKGDYRAGIITRNLHVTVISSMRMHKGRRFPPDYFQPVASMN